MTMHNKSEIIRKSLVRKTSNTEISDYGKLPPQAIQVEEAVLGAILLEHEVFGSVVRILKGDDYFYKDQHQKIYAAMIQLWIDNEPIDMITITEKLKEMGNLDICGGAYYIAQLTNKIGSAANCETHAMIIKEKWVMRNIISASSVLANEAYDETSDCFEVLEKGITILHDTLNDISSTGDKNFISYIDEFDANIQKAANNKGDEKNVIGHSFGNYALDVATLGLCAPDLVLLAGRPGEGKTTLMLQSARQNLKKGIPVGIFSLEMSIVQLLMKFYAMETGIEIQKLRTGNMSGDEWFIYENARAEIKTWSLHVCDKGGISISEIKAISSGWVSKYGVEDIYIDYLQLVTVGDVARVNSREQEIGHISRNLKALAKDLSVPIVALSQMSRAIEDRPKAERRPKNNDLRDSGSLEQDADIIIFVFRPSQHGIETLDDGSSTEGLTEFIITKCRMGALKNVIATFEGQFSRFVDYHERRYSDNVDAF